MGLGVRIGGCIPSAPLWTHPCAPSPLSPLFDYRFCLPQKSPDKISHAGCFFANFSAPWMFWQPVIFKKPSLLHVWRCSNFPLTLHPDKSRTFTDVNAFNGSIEPVRLVALSPMHSSLLLTAQLPRWSNASLQSNAAQPPNKILSSFFIGSRLLKEPPTNGHCARQR